MIKITKPGQKEFHGFCKWCGCEFTYEISDLKLSATSDKVSCPTCGKDYHHPSMVQDPTIPGGIGRLQDITWPPEPIPCTPDMTKTDPCAGCAWRENLLRDGIYIGDTPCTWCNKNKFNNITCSTPPLTGTVQGKISAMETYLTPCVEHIDTKVTSSPIEGKVQAIGASGYDCSCSTTSKEVPGTYTTATMCCNDCTKPEIDKKLQEVYDAAGVKAEDLVQGTVMSTIYNACREGLAGGQAIGNNNACHSCTDNLNNCGDTEGRNSCSGEHKCNGKKNCKGKH